VRGYETLDAGMRVLERVPARRILTPEEQAAAKAERDAALQRAKDDKQLLRLYARPVDAEQARDRQVEALQVRIDFSTNSLGRLRQSRAADAQRAATFERRGKPVPADLQQSISALDKQIKQMQGDIENRKAEQERIRKEFGPIVQRLSELTGIPASKPSAPAPAAASTPQERNNCCSRKRHCASHDSIGRRRKPERTYWLTSPSTSTTKRLAEAVLVRAVPRLSCNSASRST